MLPVRRECYVPPGWSRRERDRLARRLMLPGERPIGSRAVLLLCAVGLVLAIAMWAVTR